MCGRTSLFIDRSDLAQRFDAPVPETYEPRYNIAPGESLEVITGDDPETIQQFEWGLHPDWGENSGQTLINARSESAAEKRAFADAWESRPCLVLSSGFYEWEDGPGPSKPYRIHREDDPAFAMAGLWENGDSRPTVTILTTEAAEPVASIHDRMPVILPREREERWLTAGPDARQELCRPAEVATLDAYPISTRVNDPANDDPRVIESADSEQSDLGAFG